MYWHFKVLVDHVLAPNPFLGKKEELEALKGELNGSRQQLHLVAQVGFGGTCPYGHSGSLVLLPTC